MAMVEWTRLSGDQVEGLTATLLCRRYPDASRIRPSSGDGGIDLLVPGSEGKSVIYQVKKFASNLSSSQKSQIEKSLRRLEEYRSQHDLIVESWHLALPLDPTNENLQWLVETTKGRPYPCDWKGLSFLDGLAAEFPDVVDYYVGNGKQRLESVIEKLTSAMGMKPSGGDGLITPAQLGDYLRELAPILDTDPHFRYEVSVGPTKPYITSEPGMVFATVRTTGPDNSNAVTVRVFTRFKAALEFRPIPINVVIHAEPGSDLQRELANFTKYGTSLSAPIGTVDAKMNLPGGLGGDLTGAGLHIIAADGQANTPSHVLRMIAINPRNEIVATALIDMQQPTFGLDHTGARITGTERNGSFRVDMRSDFSRQVTTLTISDVSVKGLAPHDAVTALRVLTALQSPNRIAIAAPHGPVENPIGLPDDFALPDSASLNALIEIATSLETIQEHTTIQLAMPAGISPGEAASWKTAARLLLGEQVNATTAVVPTCLNPGVSAPEGKFAIAYYSELSVTVNSTTIPLGTILMHCPIAEVDPVSVKQHDDHIDCSIHPVDSAVITARLTRPE
ncbi:hypothetical protein [Bifidobacterium psychraerophilum]|uniref:hypothetical protein n=1 Tax=Bifidobacterium psychraerophilum TaxID=218140 RepID=UPI0033413B6A